MVYQRIATLQWRRGEEGKGRGTNDIRKRRVPMYSTGSITLIVSPQNIGF